MPLVHIHERFHLSQLYRIVGMKFILIFQLLKSLNITPKSVTNPSEKHVAGFPCAKKDIQSRDFLITNRRRCSKLSTGANPYKTYLLNW
jgi:hypothetical protein